MSDLIDRREAIDALGECPVGDTEWDLGCRNQWEWDTEILRTLPSVEPERRKGTWVVHDYALGRERYECTECRGRCDLEYNFCPHCGMEMRGKHD